VFENSHLPYCETSSDGATPLFSAFASDKMAGILMGFNFVLVVQGVSALNTTIVLNVLRF
jgi:hypothetical protein